MKMLAALIVVVSVQTLQAQNILTGRTKGPLAYLEFGPGDDRLGGAKMTYLDSNVLVNIVDSTGNDYRVRLSQSQYAFLPKNQFQPDTSLRLQPYYLTTSWRVWGDEKYDYVSVGLPERLPYKTIQQINPSRIVIDLYGATSNTNWITQLKTAKEIKNVWYEQVEDDVFRVYIELKHQQHWGYAVAYNKNNLQVRIKRQPASLQPKKLLIAIDAGHGGTNSGAKGLNSGILEKDYTLMMAKRLERYLKRKGFKVYMTRNQDVDLGMVDRTLMLKEKDPDVLLSIHLNSSGNQNAKGVSTYYRYIGFRPLTQNILDRMLELGLNNFGNIGAFNFSLSGPTEYPNCLVEVAFLSNADDEARILDKDFHDDVAKKIYKGLRDWLKKAKKD
ncbi:MAG: N-acetylmuramoyl-L-alanine amidase [Flavisolibacter sp.]